MINLEDKIKYTELSPSLQAMLDSKLEESEFIIHDENMIRHIIQEERNYWNSVEEICKKYTDEEIEKLRDWTKKKIQDETDRAKGEESRLWSAINSLESEMNSAISEVNSNMNSGFSDINKDINRKIEELKKYVENNVGVAFDPGYSISRTGYAPKSGLIIAGGSGWGSMSVYVNGQRRGYVVGRDYGTGTISVTCPINKNEYYSVNGEVHWVIFVPFK